MISAAPSVMAWPKYNPGRFPMSSGRRLSRCCPLVIPEQYDDGNIGGSQAVVERPSRPAISFRPLSMCCAPGVSGGHCRRHLAARVQSTPISSNGGRRGCLFACGEQGWRSTTRWKESRGIGRVWMESKAKLRWRRTRSEIIRQIGGKKGTKRSLLVDGRGAPLSLIVAGANRHDVKLLAATLDAIIVKRPRPTRRRPQNLCVDKGYAGKPADKEIRDRGYIPHVPKKGLPLPRGRHRTRGRARRWVVERTHSWMNNYRKLRVRYEKKAVNFEGLLHLAIAIICWRM